jgi:aminoglycoside phosphotransferase (APT) family kinase protein
LEQKIRDAKPLPENLRDAALKALETMPDGDRLCHGDFHPGNILLGRSGPVIIDWIDSSIGSPLADAARTSIMLLGAATTVSSIFLRKGIQILHTVYLRRQSRKKMCASPVVDNETQPRLLVGHRYFIP